MTSCAHGTHHICMGERYHIDDSFTSLFKWFDQIYVSASRPKGNTILVDLYISKLLQGYYGGFLAGVCIGGIIKSMPRTLDLQVLELSVPKDEFEFLY